MEKPPRFFVDLSKYNLDIVPINENIHIYSWLVEAAEQHYNNKLCNSIQLRFQLCTQLNPHNTETIFTNLGGVFKDKDTITTSLKEFYLHQSEQHQAPTRLHNNS